MVCAHQLETQNSKLKKVNKGNGRVSEANDFKFNIEAPVWHFLTYLSIQM